MSYKLKMSRRAVWRSAVLVSAAAGLVFAFAASSSSQASTAAAQGVSNYVAYTHGKSGPANSKLSPFWIGYVNDQGGPAAEAPQASTAFEWAVSYDNAHLGGIDGHPIKYSTCFIKAAEEEGLTCAEQFLNNKKIKLIDFGAVAVGAETIENADAGVLPIIVPNSVSQSDLTAVHTYVLLSSALFAVAGEGTFAKAQGAKSVAVVYPDEVPYNTIGAHITQALNDAGVKVTAVAFDPSTTDLLGAFTAAGAQTADQVVGLPDTNHCLAMVNALNDLGVPSSKVVGWSACDLAALKSQYPGGLQGNAGDYPQWDYISGVSGEAVLNTPAGLAWRGMMSKAGLTADENDNWWQGSVSGVFTIAEIANTVAKKYGFSGENTAHLDAATIAFKGPLLNGAAAGDVNCDKYKLLPGACTDGSFFVHYAGNGVFTQAGVWEEAPCLEQNQYGASRITQPCAKKS